MGILKKQGLRPLVRVLRVVHVVLGWGAPVTGAPRERRDLHDDIFIWRSD